MPRYKITQHLSGWKIVENFVDAKNEEEANELYNKGDENLNLLEWREVDEEYRINDTEITKEGDTQTEEVKKWRENKEQGHKEWKKELDRIYKED
jgi:hypothetical protein|tara:strand:+ start:193 stop:477 length:285 start_codon:yes stop_codon:yes gene_type:complete